MSAIGQPKLAPPQQSCHKGPYGNPADIATRQRAAELPQPGRKPL
jgi:hypothetical protein